MNKLGAILIKLRNERNVLQKDVAKDAQIAQRSLRYYETGKRNPDINALIKLSEYFGVSTDYLLGLTNNPTRNY